MFMEFHRRQRCPTVTGDCPEQRRLASRSGAKIQPSTIRALQWSVRNGEGHQLAALVLDSCVSADDRLKRCWITAGPDRRHR